MVAPVPAQISKLCPRLHDAARRRPPTTHYPPLTTHSLVVTPLFSYSLAPISEGYKSIFQQPLSFHIHTKPQGVWGQEPKALHGFLCALCASVANPSFSRACGLFGVSLHAFPHSFPLFSMACSLFFQNTGWGVPPLLPTTFGFPPEADSMHRSLEASLRSGEAWDKLKWMKK